jgi:hypothetical protein
VLKEFEKVTKQSVSARDKFLIAAAAVQLAQRLFASGALPEKFHEAVSAAIAKLMSLPWNRVNFPVANVLMSQTYADIFAQHSVKDADRPQLLLESLFAFLNVLEIEPELGTESVLRQIIEGDALTKTTAATPIELNYRANILRIFTPANVTAIDLEPLQIVVYRGELLGGGFGPELWGLSYSHSDEHAYVLLETGEFIRLPDKTLCLASTKDYASSEVPPYLLACARLFFPRLLGQLKVDEKTVEKLAKNFGAFTENVIIRNVPTAELENCEAVLDRARWTSHHAENSGAVKTIDVSADKNLQVVINAQQAAIRPYVSSMLVNASTGLVLMRLDTPREFSAYGIYLYPVGPASSAVISYPEF